MVPCFFDFQCAAFCNAQQSALHINHEVLGDWPELAKSEVERARLLVVFCKVSLSVMEAVGVRGPTWQTFQVLELDENRYAVTLERKSDTFTSFHSGFDRDPCFSLKMRHGSG